MTRMRRGGSFSRSGVNFGLDISYMPVARAYFPDRKRIAEMIGSDLRKVGIAAITSTTSDFTIYRDQFKRNALQAWLYGWTGHNGDPDNFLCVFFCNTTQNGRWDDAKADRTVSLLHSASAETEPLKRADLYRQASRIIQRSVPRSSDRPRGRSGRGISHRIGLRAPSEGERSLHLCPAGAVSIRAP